MGMLAPGGRSDGVSIVPSRDLDVEPGLEKSVLSTVDLRDSH
jgi:hypothetical protein